MATRTAAPAALIRLVRSRFLRVAVALTALALAVAAAVSAVDTRRASASEARARAAYPALRTTAASESMLLRAAYESPRDRDARNRFFAAAQRETSLLAVLQDAIPDAYRPTVESLQRRHAAALAVAARVFGGGRDARSSLDRARALLAEVNRGAGAGLLQIDLAGAQPWPATTLQRTEAGALAFVVLAGLLTLVRSVRKAAGLVVAPGDGDDAEIERLTHAVRSDSMTGLGNRRAFQEDLAALIDERNSTGRHFALLAFDLDGLKQINDVQGHAEGDVYIRRVADCLRDEVGPSGTVYRTGGDEFMAILPACRGWHALTVAHNIQKSASRATGGRALSIGITESTRTEGRRLLLHQADLALYEAKRGKLLAVTYHSGLEPRTATGDGFAPSQHQKALAAALARAVDARDAGTRHHSETVSELSVAIGARLGVAGARLERLRLAGLLHDVGKIGVSDAVLRKTGELTAAERAEIELHATIGHSILTSAELHEEAVWVLHHHERIDGGGYPTGLAGEEIPRESRIIAVADAFEAMTGARPYRAAMTPDEALRELMRNGGTQFDAACVRALDELFGGGSAGDELAAGAADTDATLVSLSA